MARLTDSLGRVLCRFFSAIEMGGTVKAKQYFNIVFGSVILDFSQKNAVFPSDFCSPACLFFYGFFVVAVIVFSHQRE